MKKILLLVCCILCLLLIQIPCFATETTENAMVTKEEAHAVSQEDNAQHTLFSRVWEYCLENKTEAIGLAGDAVIFALAIFVKLRNDKRTKVIASDLKIVKGDASGTASKQTSVVDAVNNMIVGYNGMRETYEKYENTENDRNRLVGAVMVQNTALLEILTTVYVNSKNLPQGVKDLINVKYANCQKALGDDEMLCAIVESVREKVGTDFEAQGEEEKAPEAAPEAAEV